MGIVDRRLNLVNRCGGILEVEDTVRRLQVHLALRRHEPTHAVEREADLVLGPEGLVRIGLPQTVEHGHLLGRDPGDTGLEIAVDDRDDGGALRGGSRCRELRRGHPVRWW